MKVAAFLAILAAIAVSILLVAAGPSEQQVDAAYLQEIEQWHAQRVERLEEPTGWLSLVGLFWLEQGENRIGSATESAVILPAGSPAHAGSLLVNEDRLTLQVAEGVEVLVNGAPPAAQQMIHGDAEDLADVITVGDLTLLVLARGDRLAVRIKDPNAETRRTFHGLERFPISATLRIEAEMTTYDPPRRRKVPTVIGTEVDYLVPGIVRFTVDGFACELEPVIADPDSRKLFFIFGDATNGKVTYGAGRFLYSDREQDGTVVLDFNRAVNPPCAFTRYATCPLPPPQNKLAVRIEAGELRYGDH